MFRKFIDKIENICTNENDTDKIYAKIKKCLTSYKTEKLNEIIEEYLFINYDKIKKYLITNDGKSYHRYILYSCELFDIITIKWEEGVESSIHDHPEKGCIMYIINDGELQEELYFYNSENKLKQFGNNKLNYGKIGYNISNKILHRIKANRFTESLHVYIPGYYKPNSYL